MRLRRVRMNNGVGVSDDFWMEFSIAMELELLEVSPSGNKINRMKCLNFILSCSNLLAEKEFVLLRQRDLII